MNVLYQFILRCLKRKKILCFSSDVIILVLQALIKWPYLTWEYVVLSYVFQKMLYFSSSADVAFDSQQMKEIRCLTRWPLVMTVMWFLLFIKGFLYEQGLGGAAFTIPGLSAFQKCVWDCDRVFSPWRLLHSDLYCIMSWWNKSAFVFPP